jgi:uncharacterized protein YjiS (DUF1127 family)
MSHIRTELGTNEPLFQSLSTTPAMDLPRRGVWPGIALRLRNWQANRRARRELAMVDAHTLRDLGISPELVKYELLQPFWRPLRDLRK